MRTSVVLVHVLQLAFRPCPLPVQLFLLLPPLFQLLGTGRERPASAASMSESNYRFKAILAAIVVIHFHSTFGRCFLSSPPQKRVHLWLLLLCIDRCVLNGSDYSLSRQSALSLITFSPSPSQFSSWSVLTFIVVRLKLSIEFPSGLPSCAFTDNQPSLITSRVISPRCLCQTCHASFVLGIVPFPRQ